LQPILQCHSERSEESLMIFWVDPLRKQIRDVSLRST
jgi:hypothetical protein